MSRRLLLVAATTGYQTRVFANAAARLGLDLVLATDRCHVLDDPWGDRAVAVRFEDPAASAEALAPEGPFDGVVAVGDRPTRIAAAVAARLGLHYHSLAAVEACRNKHAARERFRRAGLLVPSYFRVPLDGDLVEASARAPYPCVLKPLGLSASRGVIRADTPAEFVAAFGRIAAILSAPDILRFRDDQDRYIQVESFIEGREFAIEGLMSAGRLRVLAIFDKPDPLDGPYFEETIYVTPSRAGVERVLIETTRRAAQALGLEHGPIHAELRLNNAGAWPLEIAARPIGGLCAGALRFSGAPLEEIILRHAVGDDISDYRLEGPASGVMMIPIPRAGVYVSSTGEERARAVPLVEDVIITAKPGQELVPLPEGASYLGFIFARGRTPDEVESALRAAHATLDFDIAVTLPVRRQR